MSTPQKLRQRRRLRHVDNVVATLDNALKHRALSLNGRSDHTGLSSDSGETQLANSSATGAIPVAEPISNELALKETMARRHGRGPTQGEWVPVFDENGVQIFGKELLSQKAQREGTIKLLERWKAQMPTEQEMVPKDKYTIFNRKAKRYRKGLHKLPKWTRVSQRLNPPGF